ncbi:hypothetical protein E4U19_003218 [Claviceps sp. Clav32 group G5]|nr:hypothetical protein E4U19_003218 [Claviceps sp. Clav32 group G5]KAG6048347.1 hypothetical protein E4U39_007506 [Claviceps sp. Clav50 group G5]
MSHITQAEQGLKALDERKWEDALSALSKALLGSTNPAWLLARSRALISLKRYEEALEDANLAFHAAYDRNRRDLLIEAHYRRGVAYFRMGQYANGDCCCVYAMRLCKGRPAIEKEDPKLAHLDEGGFWTATLENARLEATEDPFNKPGLADVDREAQTTFDRDGPAPVGQWRRASTMRQQCLNAMEKLPAGAEARKVTVSLKPERKDVVDLATDEGGDEEEEAGKEALVQEVAAAQEESAAQPPKAKALVVQDYQTAEAITVSIFSKGVNEALLDVEFLPDRVRLNPLVYPDGQQKEWTLELYSQIDPFASSCRVSPVKVELRLIKKTVGKWARLSKEESVNDGAEEEDLLSVFEKSQKPDAVRAARGTAIGSAGAAEAKAAGPWKLSVSRESAKAAAIAAVKKPSGPVYPTSSRTGPKDWDRIAAEEEPEEEYDNGVDTFFKKIYGDGNDDQKRAMMKSFTESNGTTLSTDWKDVANRTVGVSPPAGVEAKKW